MKLKENETIPNSEFFIMEDGNPVKKNTFEFFKDKRVVLFGLPGAYTSVCSAKHLPGYVDSHDEYKAKGVDLIVCISVNDHLLRYRLLNLHLLLYIHHGYQHNQVNV